MSEPSDIVLACAADDRFGMPLAVMLRSAIDNLGPGRRVRAMVIDGGIAPWTKRRVLRSLDADRIEVRWLSPDRRRLARVKVTGHIRVASYFRLLVPELVPPSCPRAIYLDSDVVVEGDLGALWDLDLSGYPVAAAQDMCTPWLSSRYGLSNWQALGFAAEDGYFNAGVMLMDLDAWRTEKVGEAVIAYVEANPAHVRFWDQDGLNVVLHGRWLRLDPRWNLTMQPGQPLRDEDRPVVDAPFVTHYLSTHKPWDVGCAHPRRDVFFRHLDRTDWAGWRPSDALGDRLRARAEKAAGRAYQMWDELAARAWAR
jgi:lipopolysaccharide biosynthesis glycosyltransferase